MKRITELIIFILLTQSVAFGNYVETISDLPGVKYPDPTMEEGEPVITYAPYKKFGLLEGFTDLLPYLMPSPNQEGAGTCLYMSHTGIIEWWNAFLNGKENPEVGSEYDFSERYTMNLASKKKYRVDFKNWRTDTVFVFNRSRQAVLNSKYPFTKGWYKYNKEGNRVKAKEGEKGAEYGPSYNWISELDQIEGDKGVNLPKFKREILFADENKNQWATGVTPENIVEKVKDALRVNRAPVMVMYNHYGYWHIHMVVGFDDEQATDCKFTKGTAPYLEKRSKEYADQAERATDPKKKKKLERKSKSYAKNAKGAKDAFERVGGCSGKGVFYVRDSLYSDPELPTYSYHTTSPQDDRKYVKKVVLRSYEYLNTLANHVFQIMPNE